MSYILDALRRADSERERGGVPSLHSKQVPAGLAEADDDEAPVRAVQPLWWAVGMLTVVLAALLVWLVVGRTAHEAAPVVATAPPAPALAPAAAPAPVLPAPVSPEPVPPTVAAEAPVVRQEAATARATASTKPAKPAEKPAGKPAEKAPEAATATRTGDNDAPVPSISELPDDIRRQLPALSVSGASYSKNPASRMLILNGQVFKEGDKVASDLVLEQIRLKSAVLSFKGRRYSISF